MSTIDAARFNDWLKWLVRSGYYDGKIVCLQGPPPTTRAQRERAEELLHVTDGAGLNEPAPPAGPVKWYASRHSALSLMAMVGL